MNDLIVAKKLIAVISLLFALLALLPRSQPADHRTPASTGHQGGFKTVQARTSESLLGIEGINIETVDAGTPYMNHTNLNKALVALGIQHIRDHMAYNPRFVRIDQYDEFNTLKKDGIGTDLIIAPTTSQSDLAGRVAAIAKYMSNSVEAVEPPNEWNLKGPKNWAPLMISYQKAMYADVRGNHALGHTAVYGPSLALRWGYSNLGNLSSWLNYGNIHLYPGGQIPTHNMDLEMTLERTVCRNNPEVVTEAGYHDALHTNGTQPPTSDQATASYLPRLFLEYYMRGMRRVYDFELYDVHPNPNLTNLQDHFGLMTSSGAPKPQYRALQNFNHLLEDTKSNFKTGSLTYSFHASNGNTAGVESVLLEKSNGTYLLLLWRDVSVWNFHARKPEGVQKANVQLSFPSPVQRVTETDPTLSASPMAGLAHVTTVNVPVGGNVVVVSIQK